jgi:hypothetical protein
VVDLEGDAELCTQGEQRVARRAVDRHGDVPLKLSSCRLLRGGVMAELVLAHQEVHPGLKVLAGHLKECQ